MKNYTPDDETILTGWNSEKPFNSPEPRRDFSTKGKFVPTEKQLNALSDSLKRGEEIVKRPLTNIQAKFDDDRIIATWNDANQSVRLEIRPSTLSNWMDGNMDTGGVENCLYMVRNLQECVQKYLEYNFI